MWGKKAHHRVLGDATTESSLGDHRRTFAEGASSCGTGSAGASSSLTVWVAVAAFVGVLLGRAVRRRDRQVPDRSIGRVVPHPPRARPRRASDVPSGARAPAPPRPVPVSAAGCARTSWRAAPSDPAPGCGCHRRARTGRPPARCGRQHPAESRRAPRPDRGRVGLRRPARSRRPGPSRGPAPRAGSRTARRVRAPAPTAR